MRWLIKGFEINSIKWKSWKENVLLDRLEKTKGNLKLSWKLINEVINKRITKTELPNAFKEHDIEVTDHKEIAERFNIYIYIYILLT